MLKTAQRVKEVNSDLMFLSETLLMSGQKGLKSEIPTEQQVFVGTLCSIQHPETSHRK